jgi:hypothetical protein
MLQALLQRASCAPETKQPKLSQTCLKAVLPVCNGQVYAEVYILWASRQSCGVRYCKHVVLFLLFLQNLIAVAVTGPMATSSKFHKTILQTHQTLFIKIATSE